ncbi:MAG: hypothetical protein ACKOVB_20230 [Terrabacter sp.]
MELVQVQHSPNTPSDAKQPHLTRNHLDRLLPQQSVNNADTITDSDYKLPAEPTSVQPHPELDLAAVVPNGHLRHHLSLDDQPNLIDLHPTHVNGRSRLVPREGDDGAVIGPAGHADNTWLF